MCGGGSTLNLYKTCIFSNTFVFFEAEINVEETEGLCVEQPHNKLLPLHVYSDDKSTLHRNALRLVPIKDTSFLV